MNLRDAKEITIGGKSVKKIEIGGKTAWEANSPPGPAAGAYLLFYSPESFTLSTNNNEATWDGTMECSADGATWNTWDGTTTLTAGTYPGGSGCAVFLRGSGNTKLGLDGGRAAFNIQSNDVRCIGNIENILDYQTVLLGRHPSMANGCFANLFRGCTGLTEAPELPATALQRNCYSYMFEGCSALTTPPDLPGTSLAEGCYNGMFGNCTALTRTPVIQATIINGGSSISPTLGGMLDGCSSLVQPLDLRNVTSLGGVVGHPSDTIPVLFGTNLTNVSASAFSPSLSTSSTKTYYYYFTDADTPAFDPTVLVQQGSNKATMTYNIYTDNTAIHDGVLSKVDQYTIVNVYHLDGSAWA